eukprot:COSAG06_NODE_3160_length_5756_cov_2.071946_5_plen_48_part_00
MGLSTTTPVAALANTGVLAKDDPILDETESDEQLHQQSNYYNQSLMV